MKQPELELRKSCAENQKALQLFQNVSQTVSFKKFPESWNHALNCETSLRGAVYPTFLANNEEYHLPLSGQEHWVVCISGELRVVERMSGQAHTIKPGEWVSIIRRSLSEYPNLKIVSQNFPSKALWIIGHKI